MNMPRFNFRLSHFAVLAAFTVSASANAQPPAEDAPAEDAPAEAAAGMAQPPEDRQPPPPPPPPVAPPPQAGQETECTDGRDDDGDSMVD